MINYYYAKLDIKLEQLSFKPAWPAWLACWLGLASLALHGASRLKRCASKLTRCAPILKRCA